MTLLTLTNKTWVFWMILLLIIGFTLFFNRWIFVYKFEPEYWENFYYESQWNIPNSPRVIPDEGDYRYIGYRLVNGENPFNVDYWVPPLGKYLYGVTAKYLSNPYLTSFSFYILTIAIFGLLSNHLFKSNLTKWLAIYLFTLNPLLIEQIQQTMLDLPMTFFLLLSICFLFLSPKDKSYKFPLLAGLALGLMAGTKPAYFVPMITLLSLGYLYFTRGLVSWLVFLPSILVGYIGAYFCYFLQHPNPIPWIRLHQKIIDFQKNNYGSHDWINIFRTIFLNQYRGFWEGAKQVDFNWSVVLPIGTLGAIYSLLLKVKRSVDINIIFLSVLTLAYITMNTFIDFWPRYLMPLIPILTLIVGYIFRTKPLVLVIIVICTLPTTYIALFPSPKNFLETFSSNTQSGFYRETYRMLDSQSRFKIGEADWIQVNLKLKSENPTLLTSKIKLIKENNQWKYYLNTPIE